MGRLRDALRRLVPVLERIPIPRQADVEMYPSADTRRVLASFLTLLPTAMLRESVLPCQKKGTGSMSGEGYVEWLNYGNYASVPATLEAAFSRMTCG